jgi:hypothetical protein
LFADCRSEGERRVRADDGYQFVGWSTALRQSTAAEVQEYR